MLKRILHSTLPILLLGLSSLASLQAQTGPKLYPDAKDDAAWPGKGPIRTFSYMDNIRKGFWANREADQGKVVFTGDSIIGGWKLDLSFPGKPVANRGVGGDVSRGLLFRFQEDVLDLHPKALVIHIGANDITADGPVDAMISNYNEILDLAQKANPEMPIIVMAVLPHGIATGPKAPSAGLVGYLEKVNARIPQLNQELQAMAKARKNVTYVDTYTPFLLPDGKLNDALFADDKVHPIEAGRVILTEIITKALSDLKLL